MLQIKFKGKHCKWDCNITLLPFLAEGGGEAVEMQMLIFLLRGMNYGLSHREECWPNG